jgi:putative two-component system response regulator
MMHDPRVRVLVFHGDAADLAVLASVVAAHDFELHVVESSAHIVTEIARYQPDAVILDVNPRGLDGYALCREIKSAPASASVPVILTGSQDSPEARRRAVAVGCDDFLEKPINRHVLAHRLGSYARLRRAWQSASTFAALRGFVIAREIARGRRDDRFVRTCAGFGRHLGLEPAEQAALELAGELRDAGDFVLPATVGAELLETVPGTALLASIVRHRHERFDGRGSPDRLAGDSIPRVARVFRIIDAFDALTRDKPYQRAHTHAEALAIVRDDAGHGALDPSLVAAFAVWLSQEPEGEIEA